MEVIKDYDMRALDNASQSDTPSYELMENAGRAMASIILTKYNPKNVLIILGSGGNAGDGLVVGRYLQSSGTHVDLYMLSSIKNADSIKNLDINTCSVVDTIEDKYDVIVDAILGNMQEGVLKDSYIDVINKVNNMSSLRISLDTPTGINTKTGMSMGAYIKADLCICVEYPRVGLFINDGLDSCKEIISIKCNMKDISDIGIKSIHINEISDFKAMYCKRDRNTNKSSFKKSAIIAGSKAYPGASLISYNALAAFMMGVGYSRLYIPSSLYDLYSLRHPEVIVSSLCDNNGMIKYNEDDLKEVMKSDSIAIGMGMGVSEDLYKSIKYLLNNYDKTLIIDADGLNTIAAYGADILNHHKCDVIITPHPKEMERISGIDIKEILECPLDVASLISKKYNITVILKGASSVIASNEDLSINTFGNSRLAKGGSGDALSGILAGISAYMNISAYDKARMASFMLGRAAELTNNAFEATTITDIISHISDVWNELSE